MIRFLKFPNNDDQYASNIHCCSDYSRKVFCKESFKKINSQQADSAEKPMLMSKCSLQPLLTPSNLASHKPVVVSTSKAQLCWPPLWLLDGAVYHLNILCLISCESCRSVSLMARYRCCWIFMLFDLCVVSLSVGMSTTGDKILDTALSKVRLVTVGHIMLASNICKQQEIQVDHL